MSHKTTWQKNLWGLFQVGHDKGRGAGQPAGEQKDKSNENPDDENGFVFILGW